jgi:hypothetical protein
MRLSCLPQPLRTSRLANHTIAENNDFVVVRSVLLDLEDPFRVEALVQSLNNGTTFDVVEHFSIRAVPLLDLLWRERSFE